MPSVSYWPPWHGHPKPAIEIVGISVTSLYFFVLGGSSGPFGCTGQPRCAQWFEMIVKLGWPFELAVVADEGGAARHLALRRVRHEGRDDELALGVVGQRAEVVILRRPA